MKTIILEQSFLRKFTGEMVVNISNPYLYHMDINFVYSEAGFVPATPEDEKKFQAVPAKLVFDMGYILIHS